MQQDQLEIVSALAASLADRMLMERLTRGTLPLAHAGRLWTASLLLEEHERPIPGIVADVLEQVRHVEPADGADPEAGPDVTGADADDRPAPRTGRLIRLLRPFRPAAEM
ncbi:hypothetical protein [Methylobacterium sp. PvR107]|uniref:hypothetical protein n=1 Tax=Methylobacterium sp. PvR107 TaxID=2806597 RepID=UPI001B473D4E|nr:hypothetical protein [Methylobacterium sp. PvR107]MBP1180984.1 hypothetical protein [Methylobacterium sp. PvR107]